MTDVETTLRMMLDDLSKYHRDKDYLKYYYVKKRLNTSIRAQYADMMATYRELIQSNSVKVLKKFVKMEGNKKK